MNEVEKHASDNILRILVGNKSDMEDARQVSFDEGKDLEYTMAVETLPVIEPADLTGLSLERVVARVRDVRRAA